MNQSLDLDKLTTKEPDNHKVDQFLHELGNASSRTRCRRHEVSPKTEPSCATPTR